MNQKRLVPDNISHIVQAFGERWFLLKYSSQCKVSV